jgi:hypothetical protein
MVHISEKVVEMLREYHKMENPGLYLFEGKKKNEPCSEGCLQKEMKTAVKKQPSKNP